MSVFMGMLCDMLPRASNLQDKSNDVRKVLDYSVGEYMDNLSEINDELFLTSATGGWLDAWGKDYGLIRRVDEDDDSFRERIIFEKLEYLTVRNLKDIYGVRLFYAFDGFNPVSNDLTSDNPYLTDWYMGVAPLETQNILNKKFILDNSVLWYNGEELDYIIEHSTNNKLLKNYLDLYYANSLAGYLWGTNVYLKSVKLTLPLVTNTSRLFYQQTNLTDVKLNLPSSKSCISMFERCNNLTSVELESPNCTVATFLFKDCSALKNVKLDMSGFDGELGNVHIFANCTALETIDVTIPASKVEGFKSYISYLSLSNLTSLIINGEEVDLS